MSAAETEKLRLRKELEKFYPAIKNWKRDDLASGRFFASFIDRTLGGMSAAPTPPEVRERFGGKTPEELIPKIAQKVIREGLAAADAMPETLTLTEVKRLKEKQVGGDQRLTGDILPLMAELLYNLKLDVDLVFDVAAAHEKALTAGQQEIFVEAFGRGLGAFDYDREKDAENLIEKIGAKIFDRAIMQTVGMPIGEAQRKGFYVLYATSIARAAEPLVEPLPKWEPPPKDEGLDAAMGSPDEEPAAFET